MKFKSLQIVKTSELVERDIKKAIMNGQLKPGDKLPTEKEMAQQFGVSLVTLREALRGLQLFGLIEKRKGHGGGVFVSEVDNESVKDSLGHYLSLMDLSSKHLYEVREIIEPCAVRLAAQNISSDEVEKLEENVLYCEEKLRKIGPNIAREDFFDLDSNNNTFHRLIANATHNPILGLTIDYVLDFLDHCETVLLVPDLDYVSQGVRDHRSILEHLKRGDSEKCEQEMSIHLRKLDEYLVALQRKTEKSDIVFSPEGKSQVVLKEVEH